MSDEDKPQIEGNSNYESYYDETENDAPLLQIKPAGPGPLVSITRDRNSKSGLPTTKIRLKGIPTVGRADGTMQQTTKITIFGAGLRPDSIPSYSRTIEKSVGVPTFSQSQSFEFNQTQDNDRMECRNRDCYEERPPCPYRPRRCPYREYPHANILNNSDANSQGVPSAHGLADGTVAYSQTDAKTVTEPVDSKHKQLHFERHVTRSPCGSILSDTLIGTCLVNDQLQQMPCIRLAASGSPCGQPAPTSQSRLQPPQSRLQPPQSRLQAPQSRLQAPQSRLQPPQSRLQGPQTRQAPPQTTQSRLQQPQSRLQPPQSRLQPPQSRLQPPASRLAQPQDTKSKLQNLYSTIESSQSRLQEFGSKIQTPQSRLQPPQSRLQPPQSRLQPPQSRLQPPQSRLEPPQSRLQPPQSRLQAPQSRLQPPQSKLQAPCSSLQTSRTKLQAPCSSLQPSKTNLQRPKTPRLQEPSPTPGTSVSRMEESQPCGGSPRMQQTFASPERSREEPCMRVPSPKLQQSHMGEQQVKQPCSSPGMSKAILEVCQPCTGSPRTQPTYSSPERGQEPCMRSPSPKLQQTYMGEQAQLSPHLQQSRARLEETQPCMASPTMQQTYSSSPERSRAPSPRLQQPYLEEQVRMQTPSPRLQSPMRVRSPSPTLQQPYASPSSGTSRARLDESVPCMRAPSPRLQQAQMRRTPSPTLQQPCHSPAASRARLEESEPYMRIPSPRLQQPYLGEQPSPVRMRTPSPRLQQPCSSPGVSRARLDESQPYMTVPSPRMQQPQLSPRMQQSQLSPRMQQPQLSPRMQQPCSEGERTPPRTRTPSPQLKMQAPSPRLQPCSTPGTSRSRLEESSSLPTSTSRLQEPCSRPSQSRLQAPRSRLQPPQSRLQPPQSKRKTSPCAAAKPRTPSPCSSPKRSSGDVPHEKSIRVPTPVSEKPSTTDVDLLNTSHIPVCTAHATLDEIKQLIEEEKQDVLQSQTLSPDLATKLKHLKKKSLLEETLQETIPTTNVELCEGDVVSSPAPDSDVVANMMHSEECGVINTGSSPKKTYDALFGETCVTDETPSPECERSVAVSPAAPSPLNDIVVPVGEASQDEVAVVNPEIEYQVAQTDQEIPKADAYSEQQQGQLPQTCAARRECIKQKKDGSFMGPQAPRRGVLEEQKSPWDIDLGSLEDLVGGQVSMLSSGEDIPSDESIRTTLKRFEYVLDVEKPKHYSCVQLRGTQRPSWFPGYFFVHPENTNVSHSHDNENYVRLEQDPSKVFAQVWNIFKPNNLQANSEIVIL